MNAFSRSAAAFVGIAVPGVLIAVTAFVAPLPSGSGARGPEQVRLPASATTAVCPGPLSLADDAAQLLLTSPGHLVSRAPTVAGRVSGRPRVRTVPDGNTVTVELRRG